MPGGAADEDAGDVTEPAIDGLDADGEAGKDQQLLCRDTLGKAVDGPAEDVRRHDGRGAGAGQREQADGHAKAIPKDVRPQAATRRSLEAFDKRRRTSV